MTWKEGTLRTMAGAFVRAMAGEGERVNRAGYIDALERGGGPRGRCGEMFDQFALVFSPTAASLSLGAEKPYPDRIGGGSAAPRDHAVFTGWVNIAGLPAISMPVAVSKGQLPIGVQIVAAFGADAALLAFALAFSERRRGPALPANVESARPAGSLPA